MKIKQSLIWLALGITLAALVIYPREASAAMADSLRLCVTVLIPSLFPFFVLASLMVGTGLTDFMGRAAGRVMRPAFGVPGAAAPVFILGLVSGYPVGAKTAVELYRSGRCTKNEAERLLTFCNNAGPMFVLSAVGVGIWRSPAAGAALYVCHVLAALLVGVLFRFYRGPRRAAPEPHAAPAPARTGTESFGRVFVDAVRGGAMSTVSVMGFVCFFGVLIKLLDVSGVIPAAARLAAAFGLPHEWTQAALSGLVEVTAGVTLAGGMPAAPGLVLTAALLGWAGFSVHGQAMSYIAGSGLSAKPYIAGKAAQGLIAALLTALALRLLPISVADAAPAFAPGYSYIPYAPGYVPSVRALLGLWGISAALCAIMGVIYGIVTLVSKKASNKR